MELAPVFLRSANRPCARLAAQVVFALFEPDCAPTEAHTRLGTPSPCDGERRNSKRSERTDFGVASGSLSCQQRKETHEIQTKVPEYCGDSRRSGVFCRRVVPRLWLSDSQRPGRARAHAEDFASRRLRYVSVGSRGNRPAD